MDLAPVLPSSIRFDVFEVDLQSGELRKDGVRIKLQEQPFQILAMLLQRPGELIRREAKEIDPRTTAPLEDSNAATAQEPITLVTQPSYDIEPAPVHQWIALQGFQKLSDVDDASLKLELQSYLPTDEGSCYYSGDYQGTSVCIPAEWKTSDGAPGLGATALIEGVWEEDKGDFIPGTTVPLRSFFHFWDAEAAYDAGLDLRHLGYGIMPSALQTAQVRFGQAVEYYRRGDKQSAYYWLGRTAHFFMDMTVPAHTHLDPHWPDKDSYEQFVASWEFHYKHITDASPNTGIPDFRDPPGEDFPRPVPEGFNKRLTDLLYSVSRWGNQFDSDDADGRLAQFGLGKYRRASNQIDHSKEVDRVCKVGPFPLQNCVRELTSPADYFLAPCAWSSDASIVYSQSFTGEIKNLLYGAKVFYTDGTSHTFWDPVENAVPWAACGCEFQPILEASAIGYTAALYRHFWDVTHNPGDCYEENDACAQSYDLTSYWGAWLHDVCGFARHDDHDWYKIQVPSGTGCLYVECRFVHSEGDIDIDLFGPCDVLLKQSVTDKDIERICYSSPAPGTYYVKVYQLPYNGNSYDLYWGSTCSDVIPLEYPLDGQCVEGCNPGIVLRWERVERVNRYEVEVDDDPNFGSPCATAWDSLKNEILACDECGGFPPGTYYWRVRGRVTNPCNTYGEWNTRSFRVAPTPGSVAISSSAEVCEGDSIQLCAVSTGSPTSWTWASGCGGTFSTITGQCTYWKPPGGFGGNCGITLTTCVGTCCVEVGKDILIKRRPAAPARPSLTGFGPGATPDSIRVTWVATPGVASHCVYRDDTLQACVAATEWIDRNYGTLPRGYATTAANACGESGPSEQAIYTGTGVADAPTVVPRVFEVGQNYPNPFNPSTSFAVYLPKPVAYTLTIYNISGQTVRAFESEGDAGVTIITWDGTDNQGRRVASGVYLYRLQAAEFVDTKKLMLLK